jgi:crotonobetainyl-CoA:carnitine CoA-transferase CaiB-like acyl-CoA transferase
MTPRVAPLRTLRVLDHGHVWAGPLLAAGFVDMGAEVIKINAPARDSGISMGGRQLPGLVSKGAVVDREDPQQYHGFDRGKSSITLNLRGERGVELYKRLVETSDIIVENFSPGVMEELGIGYEVLSAVNPRIILASLSATGDTQGPWRDLITYGPSLAALYGIKSLLGYTDDPMPREDTADLDPTAAGHAFFAILAALEYRERSGMGQHIDMAQGEATLQRIAEPMMDYLMNGRVAGPQGNRYPGIAPHGIYRAAGEDSWISVSVRSDEEWTALLGVAGGAAGELKTPKFSTREQRLSSQDELDAAVEAWTANQDAMELTRSLQAAGVPAYAVMGPPEMLVDANFDSVRRQHVEVAADLPVSVDQIYAGIVWKLPKSPGVIQGPLPELGGGNDHVFGELLGLSEAEREELQAEGVI